MSATYKRLRGSIDIDRMARSHVTVVGCGGGARLVMNLVRCGLGRVTLIDPDVVGPENMARQDYLPEEIGESKAAALGRHLRRINPSLGLSVFPFDATTLPDAVLDVHVSCTDLFLGLTDSFAAQAWVNRMALRYRKPAIWPGLYEGGLGGEVIFFRPGLPCYRCLASGRYRAQAAAHAEGRSLDPPSNGTTIFDDAFIDVIAGQLALGLLTRGAPNRFGRLIDALGNRNFFHVKIDPEFRWNSRDLVREQLGITDDVSAFTGWSVAARHDPDHGRPPCPDCCEFAHEATLTI